MKSEYRNKQMNFRVTESEYAVIRKKMKLAGISSPSAYLRKMAMDGFIIRLDLSDLQELVRLEHINANNLNQYAKRANENGSIYAKEIQKLKCGQEEITGILRGIYEKLIGIK